MNGPAPTPEQLAAIGAAGHDVLVEAGAGTGKTAVMVDRYCRLVCEEEISTDAVLAFTFTDKAAAELRKRIRFALQERADAGSERARELVAGIGKAWVTTIHGFCSRLLSGHPIAAGVDPRFRVLDAAEAARAAREAFDEALEAFLATNEDSRERTLAAFDIGRLRSMVIGIHAELRSRGVARPELPEPPQPDVEAAVRRAAEVASATIEDLKPTNSNWVLVERARELLGRTGRRLPDLDQLAGLRTESSAKSMKEYREAMDEGVARAAEAGEGGESYRHLAVLLKEFTERFEAAKARRAGIDFEDLQIHAARLLEHSDAGQAYRARFTHLMVDEFQDTNRLQLRLIEALRGPDGKLMVVGDELQSIYGFRHADLEVFREQRRATEASPGAEAMALSGNFRSRPEVIGAVNAIGEQLLADGFRPLRVGAVPEHPAPPGEGPAVELLLTARDGWEKEGIDLQPATDAASPRSHLAEARFVAARLRELAEAGVERTEMVVLLRAFTHLDAYEDSLDRAGLRPYVVGGRGYWSQQQVADVCALLATIANPLDDQSLFGALASPACGASPDTLWLLRAAAGKGRHVWPTIERAVTRGSSLEGVPAEEMELLCGFAETVIGLRERAPRIGLANLIDAAITETGYDLAVLMRPAGEARFANVRKLIRVAAEFEEREGHDLRGLLDFLASRAEVDSEGQAATAVEGHDGVRIMTIHSAKGLEFDVVAVPHLSRALLAGARTPLLTVGQNGDESRVGMQLRRLGAASINLYAYRELREAEQERDAAEELRLFHVAATRARERLILSGVVKPKPAREAKPGTPILERIVEALEIDREHDSTLDIAAPQPREGLDASFGPSELAVRVSLPSAERAAELTAGSRREDAAPDLGEGPPPLVEERAPAAPAPAVSYTALTAHGDCAYRFYMERVLGMGAAASESAPAAGANGSTPPSRVEGSDDGAATASAREERTARGTVVHALLEWSLANGWSEPPEELARRHAVAAGLDPAADGLLDEMLGPVRSWLASDFLRERVGAGIARSRAEVPVLLNVDGTIVRGSIDLLVEREGSAPLVVDYKTDRLEDSTSAERSERYAVQRAIYAVAVGEALPAAEVEVAYVFLERPDEPDLHAFGSADLEAARRRLEGLIGSVRSGAFPAAPEQDRSWALCQGCPALDRLCSGPPKEPATPSETEA
jgi:ATP-dependent exoDNAse (exonuclease V) beta subunit